MKIRILFAALLSAFMSKAQVPEQDCLGALPVCQQVVHANNTLGSGFVPNEVNNTTSCLGSGELNSMWFKVYVANDGILSFNIIPDMIGADYDWAVFDLTNHNCSDIFFIDSLQVSCNFSGLVTNYTGPNGGSDANEEPPINVKAGEVYYIIISCFSTEVSGFTLDFNASTIFGNSGPVGFNDVIVPSACQANELNVFLNQPVQCISLSPSDFALFDANNQQVPIVSMNSVKCDNLLDYVASFMLNLGANLQPGQQYKLIRNGSLTAPCNNISNDYDEVYFTAFGENIGVTAFAVTMDTCSNSATIYPVINNPETVISYDWTLPDGGVSNFSYVYANLDGDYTLTTTTTAGCTLSYTEYVDIFEMPPQTLSMQFVGDTIYATPNIFPEYKWDFYRSNGTPQLPSAYTQYPINYILMSDYNIYAPCRFTVMAENNFGCVLYSQLTDDKEIQAKPYQINTLVNTIVAISSPTPLSGIFTIYNLSGMLMQSTRVDNTGSIQLDMGGYAEGLYILNFTNSQGQSYSTKLVKIAD